MFGSHWASPVACSKESACQYWRKKRHRFDPLWVGKIPEYEKEPTPVFLLLENFMDRGVWVSRSPRGHREPDLAEHEHEGMRLGLQWVHIQENYNETHGSVPGLGPLLIEYPF